MKLKLAASVSVLLFACVAARADHPLFLEHDAFFHFEWPELSEPDIADGRLTVKYMTSEIGFLGWTSYFGTSKLVIRDVDKLLPRLQYAVKFCRKRHVRLEQVFPPDKTRDKEHRQVKNPIHVFVYNRGVDFEKVVPFLKLNEQSNEDIASWDRDANRCIPGRFFSDMMGYDTRMAADVPSLTTKMSTDREIAEVDGAKICCLMVCDEDLKDITFNDCFSLDERSNPYVAFFTTDEAGSKKWEEGYPHWKATEDEE